MRIKVKLRAAVMFIAAVVLLFSISDCKYEGKNNMPGSQINERIYEEGQFVYSDDEGLCLDLSGLPGIGIIKPRPGEMSAIGRLVDGGLKASLKPSIPMDKLKPTKAFLR